MVPPFLLPVVAAVTGSRFRIARGVAQSVRAARHIELNQRQAGQQADPFDRGQICLQISKPQPTAANRHWQRGVLPPWAKQRGETGGDRVRHHVGWHIAVQHHAGTHLHRLIHRIADRDAIAPGGGAVARMDGYAFAQAHGQAGQGIGADAAIRGGGDQIQHAGGAQDALCLGHLGEGGKGQRLVIAGGMARSRLARRSLSHV